MNQETELRTNYAQLLEACRKGVINRVKALISKGLEPDNSLQYYLELPLRIVFRFGHHEIGKILLQNGAILKKKDQELPYFSKLVDYVEESVPEFSDSSTEYSSTEFWSSRRADNSVYYFGMMMKQVSSGLYQTASLYGSHKFLETFDLQPKSLFNYVLPNEIFLNIVNWIAKDKQSTSIGLNALFSVSRAFNTVWRSAKEKLQTSIDRNHLYIPSRYSNGLSDPSTFYTFLDLKPQDKRFLQLVWVETDGERQSMASESRTHERVYLQAYRNTAPELLPCAAGSQEDQATEAAPLIRSSSQEFLYVPDSQPFLRSNEGNKKTDRLRELLGDKATQFKASSKSKHADKLRSRHKYSNEEKHTPEAKAYKDTLEVTGIKVEWRRHKKDSGEDPAYTLLVSKTKTTAGLSHSL